MFALVKQKMLSYLLLKNWKSFSYKIPYQCFILPSIAFVCSPVCLSFLLWCCCCTWDLYWFLHFIFLYIYMLWYVLCCCFDYQFFFWFLMMKLNINQCFYIFEQIWCVPVSLHILIILEFLCKIKTWHV